MFFITPPHKKKPSNLLVQGPNAPSVDNVIFSVMFSQMVHTISLCVTSFFPDETRFLRLKQGFGSSLRAVGPLVTWHPVSIQFYFLILPLTLIGLILRKSPESVYRGRVVTCKGAWSFSDSR